MDSLESPISPPLKKVIIKNKKVIKFILDEPSPLAPPSPPILPPPPVQLPYINHTSSNNTPSSHSQCSAIPFDPEKAYIESFSEKEKKAYLIAKSHLLTTFSLKKSNGFVSFMKSKT